MQCTHLLNLCHWTFSQNYTLFEFFIVKQFGITGRDVRDLVSLNTWSPTLRRDLLPSSATRVSEMSVNSVPSHAVSHKTGILQRKRTVWEWNFLPQIGCMFQLQFPSFLKRLYTTSQPGSVGYYVLLIMPRVVQPENLSVSVRGHKIFHFSEMFRSILRPTQLRPFR